HVFYMAVHAPDFFDQNKPRMLSLCVGIRMIRFERFIAKCYTHCFVHKDILIQTSRRSNKMAFSPGLFLSKVGLSPTRAAETTSTHTTARAEWPARSTKTTAGRCAMRSETMLASLRSHAMRGPRRSRTIGREFRKRGVRQGNAHQALDVAHVCFLVRCC